LVGLYFFKGRKELEKKKGDFTRGKENHVKRKGASEFF
jgi:hypothetical protein